MKAKTIYADENINSFTSSFPIFIYFIYFSWLIILARTFKIMLNGHGKWTILSCFCSWRESFQTFTTEYDASCALVI